MSSSGKIKLLNWMGNQDAAALVRGQRGTPAEDTWVFYWQPHQLLLRTSGSHNTWWAALSFARDYK